jgi:hypothetical protein
LALYDYSMHGNRRQMSLGSFPEVGIKEARALRFEANKLVGRRDRSGAPPGRGRGPAGQRGNHPHRGRAGLGGGKLRQPACSRSTSVDRGPIGTLPRP